MVERHKIIIESTGHSSSPSRISADLSVSGPPRFLTWLLGNSRRKECTHPLWNICKVWVLLYNGRGPAHNAGKFCTAALDDASGAGQKITSSHCTLSLCGWVAGEEVLSGNERQCVPFVFISNCINPCSFQGGGCAPGWSHGAVKESTWQWAGKKLPDSIQFFFLIQASCHFISSPHPE